jgi:thioredoxin 1
MVELSEDTFDAALREASGPVVVDFWAPWCGPCRAVEPILEELERAHAHVTFARLNVDEHPVVAARYGVLSLPAAILFEGGEPRESVVGARPAAHYLRAWGPWLSESSR